MLYFWSKSSLSRSTLRGLAKADERKTTKREVAVTRILNEFAEILVVKCVG